MSKFVIKIFKFKLFTLKGCCLIILMLLLACNQKQLDLQEIEVTYYKAGLLFPVKKSCKQIINSFRNFPDEGMMRQKIIRDKSFLKSFIALYNTLEEDNYEEFVDMDIHIVLKYYNKKNDTLCLGEDYGTYKNGILQKDNLKFIELIKNKIGFYGIKEY